MTGLARGIRTLALATAAVMAVGAAPATAQNPDRIDLTGEWVLTVMSPNGEGRRSVTFQQEGDDLTGTYSSSMSEGTVVGTVDQSDGTVMFTATVTMSTGDFDILYIGTWVDGEIVNGEIDFGDYGDGTFTGRRVEEDGGGR